MKRAPLGVVLASAALAACGCKDPAGSAPADRQNLASSASPSAPLAVTSEPRPTPEEAARLMVLGCVDPPSGGWKPWVEPNTGATLWIAESPGSLPRAITWKDFPAGEVSDQVNRSPRAGLPPMQISAPHQRATPSIGDSSSKLPFRHSHNPDGTITLSYRTLCGRYEMWLVHDAEGHVKAATAFSSRGGSDKPWFRMQGASAGHWWGTFTAPGKSIGALLACPIGSTTPLQLTVFPSGAGSRYPGSNVGRFLTLSNPESLVPLAGGESIALNGSTPQAAGSELLLSAPNADTVSVWSPPGERRPLLTEPGRTIRVFDSDGKHIAWESCDPQKCYLAISPYASTPEGLKPQKYLEFDRAPNPHGITVGCGHVAFSRGSLVIRIADGHAWTFRHQGISWGGTIGLTCEGVWVGAQEQGDNALARIKIEGMTPAPALTPQPLASSTSVRSPR